MKQRPRTIRLFVDVPLKKGTILTLPQDRAHYLKTVMRITEGQTIQLFNGSDGEWQGLIEKLDRKAARVKLTAQTRRQTTEGDLWLLFSPLKKTPMTFTVEKACELGVSRLYPVITEFTQTRRVNRERLSANAMEAAEQCHRLSVPPIFPPAPLKQVLENWPSERKLVFLDETGRGNSPIETYAHSSQPIGFLVGPEGGFSPRERDMIRRCPDVLSLSLGPRMLRAETAALAAIACFQALAGDWRRSDH